MEGLNKQIENHKDYNVLTADKIKEILNEDDYEYYNIKDGIKVPIPKNKVREEKLNEPYL